jgi:hypothetical protein
MSQTVVARFRDVADAQLARALLLAEGVAADDIEIDDPPARNEPQGLARLFRLFGADGAAADAASGDGAAIKVVVGDMLDPGMVRHALTEFGAAEVHSEAGAGATMHAARAIGLTAAFKRHYQERYAATGASYSIYEPAYRYGASLVWEASQPQGEWKMIEDAARRGWQARHRGSNWDHFQAAVRYGWSEARRNTLP